MRRKKLISRLSYAAMIFAIGLPLVQGAEIGPRIRSSEKISVLPEAAVGAIRDFFSSDSPTFASLSPALAFIEQQNDVDMVARELQEQAARLTNSLPMDRLSASLGNPALVSEITPDMTTRESLAKKFAILDAFSLWLKDQRASVAIAHQSYRQSVAEEDRSHLVNMTKAIEEALGPRGFQRDSASLDLVGAVFGKNSMLPTPSMLQPAPHMVNDVTQINPIAVDRVATPLTTAELRSLVKNNPGPISIGGGHFSMGGQTAADGGLHVDMRHMDKVLAFWPEKREITVQTGITWRSLLEKIDAYDLTPAIMQSYSNFTVGGSLSVNAHGRYVGLGPLILSVKSIKVVLADGRIVEATPTQNPEIFYGAIGGYGALGIIAEATLSLAENRPVELVSATMPTSQYPGYFKFKVSGNSKAVFHNADFSPDLKSVRAVTWVETNNPLQVKERLQERHGGWLDNLILYRISYLPLGKWARHYIWQPLSQLGRKVVWRSYEASYDAAGLEPKSRENSTYVLQEYFVPVDQFNAFVPKLAEILKRHGVNTMNVSIRHAKADPGSKLAWAREDVFAFVLYYAQGTSEHEKDEVAVWTRELIDAAIALGGAYYLPYQIHGTQLQFHASYPQAKELFETKKELDPDYKFRNKLLDTYYRPWLDRSEPANGRTASDFRTVFGKTELRDAFYRFLQVVYNLRPENRFHHLIYQMSQRYSTDEEIYRATQARLSEITPWHSLATYGLPSLWKQRKEMVDETAELLGPRSGTKYGYVEIGTTGRYASALRQRLGIAGPTYVINDVAPSYAPGDIFERGGIRKAGTFFGTLNDPITREQIPDASVDLVTIYIGVHHVPREKLDAFIRSIHRILRPGGKLVIRDHDVDSKEMASFVHLAHQVYNLGLGMPWEENAKEINQYMSAAELERYVEARGFSGLKKHLLQENDPTRNTLMGFVKEESKPSSQGDGRTAARSYLTYPEWYIVFNAREQAEFLANGGRPSAFPYFGAIAQYWSGYQRMWNATYGRYPFSLSDHFMLTFIGGFFTVENGIKGFYEKTAGRLFEWIGGLTAEDAYAQKIAVEYARFLDIEPWYRFPFGRALNNLWTDNRLIDRGLPRKWERRLALSLEYSAKTVLGRLITKVNGESYAPEETKTRAVVENVSPSELEKQPQLKVLRQVDPTHQLIEMPRYEPFSAIALTLARSGVNFEEVAGNTEIVLSLTAPSNFKMSRREIDVVSDTKILTQPKRRIALRVGVENLGATVRDLEASGATVEHIFDY